MEQNQQQTKNLGTAPSERFEIIEGRLLPLSVPLYFVAIVLLIVASTFASIPWVTLPTHLLISLLSVLIAFVLLIKWVTMLRKMSQAVADRGSDETTAVAIGAACICLLLAGLIVLVAAHAGEASTPMLVLLVIEPILLIWQYLHIASGEHEN